MGNTKTGGLPLLRLLNKPTITLQTTYAHKARDSHRWSPSSSTQLMLSSESSSMTPSATTRSRTSPPLQNSSTKNLGPGKNRPPSHEERKKRVETPEPECLPLYTRQHKAHNADVGRAAGAGRPRRFPDLQLGTSLLTLHKFAARIKRRYKISPTQPFPRIN